MRALVALLISASPALAADAEAAFALRVLPVLKAKCFACHGDDPKALKGGLDLTGREKLLAGGGSKRPAVAMTAADSPLYRAVVRTDAAVKPMPPKENDRLTAVLVGLERKAGGKRIDDRQ